MLKISKKNEARLNCICGLCDHDCMSKNCIFNKILESLHPEEAQKKQFIALMKDIFAENTEKA